MRCPGCGQSGWHKVYKAADFPVTSVSSWPLIRFLLFTGLIIVLTLLVFIAVVLGVVLKLAGVI